MALPTRPLKAPKGPLRAVSGNAGRLASPAKKRLGHALAYGVATKKPEAAATAALAPVVTPQQAADMARKLCAEIMSRTKVPAEAAQRLETAKAAMIELCAGLMARGAIAVEVATAGCSIDGTLLPHIESFMGWIQSGFLDSITMAEHGALLRAQCGEINREIDTLLKGGEVRKFVSGLRPKEAPEPDAVNVAKDRVQARQAGKSPAKTGRRPSSKRSARGASPARANSAPPDSLAAARTCSNGSDVATKPRVATSRPKVWAPAKPAESTKRKPSVPVQPPGSRARSARGGRRPVTANSVGTAAGTKAAASAVPTANMGQAVENALQTARAGEKRRRDQIQSERSAEEAAASRKSGRADGQQPEPLFESWKEKGKILAAASDSFRRNTEASLKKINSKGKGGSSGVDDLKAEMAKLKGPGPTRPPSSRSSSRCTNSNDRKATAVPTENTALHVRPRRDAYDEFVQAFQKEQQTKQTKRDAIAVDTAPVVAEKEDSVTPTEDAMPAADAAVAVAVEGGEDAAAAPAQPLE